MARHTRDGAPPALWVDREGLERDLLLVLALNDGPKSRSELVQLLSFHGVRDMRGRQHSAAALEAPLEAMRQDGRLVGAETWHRHVGFAAPDATRFAILEEGVASGRLRVLAGAILADTSYRNPYYAYGRRRGVAATRLALLLEPPREGARALSELVRYERPRDAAASIEATIGRAPRAEWLSHLAPEVRDAYVEQLFEGAFMALRPVGDAVLAAARASEKAAVRARAARVAALRGDAVDLDALGLTPLARAEVELFARFYAGDVSGAREAGERVATSAQGAKPRKLSHELAVPLTLARIVASGRDGTAWTALLDRADADRRANAAERAWVRHHALGDYIEAVQARRPFELARRSTLQQDGGWDDLLAIGLYYVWAPGKAPPRALAEALRTLHGAAERGGWRAAARHVAETLAALEGDSPAEGSLAAAHRPRAAWEMALDALEQLAGAEAPAPPGGKDARAEARVVFQLELRDGHVDITPRRFASGRARVSKPVAVDDLLRGEHPYLTAQDRAVLALSEPVHEHHPRSGRARVRQGLRRKALPALVDHPGVVDESGAPLRVIRGEGELRAERVDGGRATRLAIHPPELVERAIVAVRDGVDQVIVYERSEELTRVAGLLTHGPLEVPAAGEARLGAVLGRIGQKVRVGAGASVALEGEEVAPEVRPALLCRFHGERLEVRLRAAPLGLAGPHVRPGQGPAQIVAVVDGAPLRASRDLDAERRARSRLFAQAPALAELAWQDDALVVEGLEAALDFLVVAGALDGEACILAWPDGARLPVPVSRDVAHLRVQVGEGADWLRATVTLAVDEARVVHFRELLAQRTPGGRYVRLEDGSFVALTAELARRVDALGAAFTVGREGALEASPVLLPRLAELTDDVGERKLDRASAKRLRALEAALSATVEVPGTFEASLRDYQEQGFVWMARLAEAGLGACLADDMGLGKTVQALALLARRARLGPALVVAPTSVVSAWVSEARRFVPSLDVVVLPEAASRRARLDGAAPGQLFVATYGVLVTEAEALAATRFSTVVFDEAHLLKNARTQRAKAAFALDAGFRAALTGTPVENHLGELWSLMRAVLPGLLGTEKDFAARFDEPIGRGDRAALGALRAVLRPFLLRRTKAEVLDELPERSETTLLVEPGPDERAYYEALRERAMERVAADDGAAGAARVRLLAEITHLRQAAVDPRLLDPEAAPAGAKLEVLAERVVALHEEGHRPLVFTQFLGSLALIEARLATEGLRVLTLDGSLSAKVRAERVAAFQAGEADAFVMSLHAGGVGITLTAADYVFHVDPWWNPAVEDQATGRAHRIGQRRPVHVYRLVTAGSIEEKILALHRTKKKLAGDLLSGLDEAKKLDLDTLRGLLAR